jgi:protoporphyrinogen/coproporphyrinogen III oxidase
LSPDEPVVAVVGGGITGLSAAHRLLHPAPPGAGPRVVVVEAGDRLGGKISTETIGGRPMEAGPDAFVAGPERDQARALCHELGLSDQLVSPATGRAFILLWNRLCPIPPGQVLGVPTSLRALGALRRAGLISRRGVARGSLDLVLPKRASSTDVQTVAEIVGHRFGTQVLSRVVGPIAGGIHAGSVGGLSAAAVTPQLLEAARSHRSMMRGLEAGVSSGGRAGGPGVGADGVRSAGGAESDAPTGQPRPRQGFFSLAGGLSGLVERLVEAIGERGGDLRVGAPALALSREDGRWRLDLLGGDRVVADAVVLTVPSFSAAGLLEPHDPALADLLRSIEYASVALVTLTYPEDSVAHPLDGAGFLVTSPWSWRHPHAPTPLLTACTWTTSKWPQTKLPGQVVLRASTGRDRDNRPLEMADEQLVTAVQAELAPVLGLSAPPSEAIVNRWPHSFPQYNAGHLQKVARIEAAADRLPGVALAGAAYRGLGIPACIGQGQEAAAKVAADLGAVVPG